MQSFQMTDLFMFISGKKGNVKNKESFIIIIFVSKLKSMFYLKGCFFKIAGTVCYFKNQFPSNINKKISNFWVFVWERKRGGQEIEFYNIEAGDRNYCLQNCSGDRKGPRGPRGLG